MYDCLTTHDASIVLFSYVLISEAVRENHSLPRRLDNDSMLAEREAHSISTNRENRLIANRGTILASLSSAYPVCAL